MYSTKFLKFALKSVYIFQFENETVETLQFSGNHFAKGSFSLWIYLFTSPLICFTEERSMQNFSATIMFTDAHSIDRMSLKRCFFRTWDLKINLQKVPCLSFSWDLTCKLSRYDSSLKGRETTQGHGFTVKSLACWSLLLLVRLSIPYKTIESVWVQQRVTWTRERNLARALSGETGVWGSRGVLMLFNESYSLHRASEAALSSET